VTETLAQADLRPILAAWLPGQRWFPRQAAGHDLVIVEDVQLVDGDPQLRQLIVQVGDARFQVLVGLGSEPPAAPGAVIGDVGELTAWDALHDPRLAAVLLEGIAEQRRVGPVRFVRAPATPLASMPGGVRVMTAEQSNTSLVFGEMAILKVLRRLFPGANPDLEVAEALDRLGSPRIAAPFGWIETRIEGEPVLLAVLSEYLADAREGWALAGEAFTANEPFTTEAHDLGTATALLHSDLATAFGSREMTPDELGSLVGTVSAKLDDALRLVPELRPHAAKVAAAYADLGKLAGPIPVQRIHGDYHLGQVMLSTHGWVALDFEGEPATPLAQRRAFAPALRDVAGMLRSFDYAARQRLIGQSPDGQADMSAASQWVGRCQEEFCAGYAEDSEDPREAATLLRALTLEKAVYEVVYEYRHRPSWLPIPLGYVAAA
jgi:maltokinase